MSGIANKAIDTAKSAATYATTTASSAVNYATSTASSAVNYATSTASSAVNYVGETVTAAQTYATNKASSALEFGKVAVQGATTTITAYTPGPVLHLVTSTLEGAKALRQDPVGTVKPYVPTFVIHAGEKTYEIVQHTKDRTTQNVNAVSGFIVTKVNGTVEYVTSVPAIGSLIEQINKLTAPVLSKLGVKLGENTENGGVAAVNGKENHDSVDSAKAVTEE